MKRRRTAERFDVRGISGSRRRYDLCEDRVPTVTLSVRVLDDAPPDGHSDKIWLETPDGRRLVPRRARELVETFTGLHRVDDLAARAEDHGYPVELIGRLRRSGWLVTLPPTVVLADFDAHFAGLALTRLDGSVERLDPADGQVSLGGRAGGEPIVVTSWLYQHLAGPRIRPGLCDAVAFGVEDATTWVRRVAIVLDVLPRLLGEQVAILGPSAQSAAARLSHNGARSIIRRPIRPDHDEILSFVIFVLSKV